MLIYKGNSTFTSVTYVREKPNPGAGQTFHACRLRHTAYLRAAQLPSGTATSTETSPFSASVVNGKTTGSVRSTDVHDACSFLHDEI